MVQHNRLTLTNSTSVTSLEKCRALANVNVLPACGWLTKFIWASISSIKHLLMVNAISVPLLREKCRHLGLGIQWCEHHRAFHFSHKKAKIWSFPNCFSSFKTTCIERNTGSYRGFFIFICIHPISHLLNFGFCCKIEICNINLFNFVNCQCEQI